MAEMIEIDLSVEPSEDNPQFEGAGGVEGSKQKAPSNASQYGLQQFKQEVFNLRRALMKCGSKKKIVAMGDAIYAMAMDVEESGKVRLAAMKMLLDYWVGEATSLKELDGHNPEQKFQFIFQDNRTIAVSPANPSNQSQEQKCLSSQALDVVAQVIPLQSSNGSESELPTSQSPTQD